MSKVKVIVDGSFDKICSAVDKTVNLIKPTFGPASNKVIISKVTHSGVLDDGVQIARDLELEDPVENAVMKIVREAAVRTNDRVGDGTTGSLILLQALIREYANKVNRNGRATELELKKAFEECKEQLKAMAQEIRSKEELERVARISYDDPDIAKLIAEAWHKLGVDGVLTVDRSGSMETTVNITEGITIDRGYISPYMITDPKRMEGVVEKPYILLTDYRLTEPNDVIGIMNKLMENGVTNLIIIADNVEQGALGTLVLNKTQGKFNGIAINIPSGENKTQILEDIGIQIGAKVFSEKKGNKVSDAEIEDLGRADRFVARRDESVIIGPSGDKEKVDEAVSSLKTALEITNPDSEEERKELQNRIAGFTNKIGVIKVGAPTENEMKALKYKVEDAVHSTHAAFKSGVVPGGGLALSKLHTSSDMFNSALLVPFRQLLDNSGADAPELNEGDGFDVVTQEIGPWMEIGALDPVEVLIAQIESAVSIASLLITSSGMIVEQPKHIKEE